MTTFTEEVAPDYEPYLLNSPIGDKMNIVSIPAPRYMANGDANHSVPSFLGQKGTVIMAFKPDNWSGYTTASKTIIQAGGSHILYNKSGSYRTYEVYIYKGSGAQNQQKIWANYKFVSDADVNQDTILTVQWDDTITARYIRVHLIVNGESKGWIEKDVSNATGSRGAGGTVDLRAGATSTYGDGMQWNYILGSDSLTRVEVDEMVKDPHQFFKTAEDVVKDYELKFKATASVTLPIWTCPSATYFRVRAKFTFQLLHALNLIGASGGGGLTFTFLSDGKIRANVNGNFTESTRVFSDGELVDITVERLDWGYLGIYFDGSTTADASRTGANNSVDIDTLNLTDNYTGGFRYLELETAGDHRYYDFNRLVGAPQELLQGLHATKVGFPDESGYIVENGETVGYYCNGDNTFFDPTTNHAIPTTNDWILTIVVELTNTQGNNLYGLFGRDGNDLCAYREDTKRLYLQLSSSTVSLYLTNSILNREATIVITKSGADYTIEADGESVTQTLSGEAQLQVRAMMSSSSGGQYEAEGILKEFRLTCSTTPSYDFDYDFTTGDADSIPNKIGTNHAAITNRKTSGWMPVVEKQVFTVAPSGADYANIGSLNSGQGQNSNPVVGLILDDISMGSGSVFSSSYTADITYQAADTETKPIVTTTSVTISSVGNYTFTGLQFELAGGNSSSTSAAIIISTSGNLFFETCEFNNANGNAIYCNTSGANLAFRYSSFSDNGGAGARINTSSSCSVVDCLIVNNNHGLNSAFTTGFRFPSSATVINTISANNSVKDFYGSANGSNNVSSDGTAFGDGNIKNLDFTGAF